MALRAGASLIALGAIGAPIAATAACSGADQTIASAVTGPVLSTGGGISVQGSGGIGGQAAVTITGGKGKTYGAWTGGTITVGNGNLVFAGGNTAISDDIAVNGGTGTVTNDDPLKLTAPITIIGNFNQGAIGALDFALGGATVGQYGALAVTGSTSLDGGLGLDLTNGYFRQQSDVRQLSSVEETLPCPLQP